MKKKIKTMLLLAAIVLGVTGAVASSALVPYCDTLTQYYRDGNGNYIPAGTEGVDYMCAQDNNICTYTYRPQAKIYVACKRGRFLLI